MITSKAAIDLATVFRHAASCKATGQLKALMKMDYNIVGIFSGNQAGKTWGVAYTYFLRILGIHPVERLNKLARKIRCMSPSLPQPGGNDDQDNTQYLEFKKLLPAEMIVKDVTARNSSVIVRRPDGSNSILEFKSVHQEMQDLGRIQLSSCWHDEETPRGHRDECKMRLLAEGGDELFSLTPTNALSYTYAEVWQRAEEIYRTPTIQKKFNLPEREYPNKGTNIGCIQMATDDNPTLELSTIDFLFQDITDPAELALRRYGVFSQISGRVHKTYDPAICYIDFKKLFDRIPYEWMHTIGIDYHESRIPWSIGFMSCSPDDEWFLWKELHPAIDGPNAYNTYDITKMILRSCDDYIYKACLMDPLANKKQSNTNTSVIDDINRHVHQIRRDTGIGTNMFFQPWDTKGVGGRDEISKRFKNASRVGRPFNNLVRENGKLRRLPTLWISHECPKFHKSIMNWCYGEFVTASVKAVNDPKPTPQQKNSHDCMVLECLAKDNRVLNASFLIHNPARQVA